MGAYDIQQIVAAQRTEEILNELQNSPTPTQRDFKVMLESVINYLHWHDKHTKGNHSPHVLNNLRQAETQLRELKAKFIAMTLIKPESVEENFLTNKQQSLF